MSDSNDNHTAAWMADPFGRHQLRYWNGSQWTSAVSNDGVMLVDPPNAGPEGAIDADVTTPPPPAARPAGGPSVTPARQKMGRGVLLGLPAALLLVSGATAYVVTRDTGRAVSGSLPTVLTTIVGPSTTGPTDTTGPATTSPTSTTAPSTTAPRSVLPPKITAISLVRSSKTQDITITGTGFGTYQPTFGVLPCISFVDRTGSWTAGHVELLDGPFGSGGACSDAAKAQGDSVTLNIAEWSDTAIRISGFGGTFGKGATTLHGGDFLEFQVRNATTGAGPATMTTAVMNGDGSVPVTLDYVDINGSDCRFGIILTTAPPQKFGPGCSVVGGSAPRARSLRFKVPGNARRFTSLVQCAGPYITGQTPGATSTVLLTVKIDGVVVSSGTSVWIKPFTIDLAVNPGQIVEVDIDISANPNDTLNVAFVDNFFWV